MIEQHDVAMIDECLSVLPKLLRERGIMLKQKRGYKAGKLCATRNWCQFVDGDAQLSVTLPNRKGQVKTWKVFARFHADQPPSWPWDRPERYGHRNMQWMPVGNDVWGLSYEDLRDWTVQTTSHEILECLVNNLQASLNYAVSRYR